MGLEIVYNRRRHRRIFFRVVFETVGCNWNFWNFLSGAVILGYFPKFEKSGGKSLNLKIVWGIFQIFPILNNFRDFLSKAVALRFLIVVLVFPCYLRNFCHVTPPSAHENDSWHFAWYLLWELTNWRITWSFTCSHWLEHKIELCWALVNTLVLISRWSQYNMLSHWSYWYSDPDDFWASMLLFFVLPTVNTLY